MSSTSPAPSSLTKEMTHPLSNPPLCIPLLSLDRQRFDLPDKLPTTSLSAPPRNKTLADYTGCLEEARPATPRCLSPARSPSEGSARRGFLCVSLRFHCGDCVSFSAGRGHLSTAAMLWLIHCQPWDGPDGL